MTDNNISRDESLDFSQKVLSGPNYRLLNIPQKNGGSETIPLTRSSGATAEIEIPSDTCINLPRSFAEFVNSSGRTEEDNKFAGMLVDFPPIRKISLLTKGGQPIQVLENLPEYWKMTKNLTVKKDEFEAYGPAGFAAGADVDTAGAAAKLKGVCYYHNPANALLTTAPAIGVDHGKKILNPVANPQIPRINTNTELVGRRNYTSEIPYITAADGKVGEVAVYSRLMLGKIPFTIFSCDRDIYTPQSLILKFEFAPFDDYIFQHTAEGTLVGNLALSQGAGSVAPKITNFKFYLAIQRNQSVIDALRNKVLSSGLKYVFPEAVHEQETIGTGTQFGLTRTLNMARGARLLRVISAEQTLVNTLALKANFANYNGAHVTTFNTTWDSELLQQEVLTTANGDDFRYNVKKFKGTPLENMNEYYSVCPVHIDDFSGVENLTQAPELDLKISGLPLNKDHTWAKKATKTSGAGSELISNVISIYQNTLKFSPLGCEKLIE